MNRRYVRITVQTLSGKPITGLERAGGHQWLAYTVAMLAGALGFILLVGGG